MRSAAISVRDLTFTYNGQKQPALASINLDIEPGTCTAVWGDAKSTFCMALCGVIPHLIPGRMTGEVRVNGKETRTRPLREIATEVGVVLQDPENQLFNLTVEGDVAFGMENLRVPREEMSRRIAQALEVVRMTPFRHRASHELSGGQKQRVAIAAVLAMQPRILVLDEPTRELDPLGTEEVFELLGRLKRDGVTIIIVENDASRVAPLSDRVLLLRGGRVAVDAPPGEFYRQAIDDPRIRIPQCTEAFFRAPPPSAGGRIPLTVEEAVELYGAADHRHR